MSIFGKRTPTAILQSVRTFLRPQVGTSLTRYIRRDSDVKNGQHVKHFNRVRQLMNLRTNRMAGIHSKIEALRDERKSRVKQQEAEFLKHAHFDRMGGSLDGSFANYRRKRLEEYDFNFSKSLFFEPRAVNRARHGYHIAKTEMRNEASWATNYLRKLLLIIGLRKT